VLDLKDKNLTCDSCKETFVFTKGEQEYFLKKAFSEPKRCSNCRKTRRKERRKKRKTLLRSLKTTENVQVGIVEPEKKPAKQTKTVTK